MSFLKHVSKNDFDFSGEFEIKKTPDHCSKRRIDPGKRPAPGMIPIEDAEKVLNIILNSRIVPDRDIERVIYNPPATIVLWKDGTKTVVECQKRSHEQREKFDPEKGLAMAVVKRLCGNNGSYNEIFKKFEYAQKKEETK